MINDDQVGDADGDDDASDEDIDVCNDVDDENDKDAADMTLSQTKTQIQSSEFFHT